MKSTTVLVFILLALHTSQATLSIIEKMKREAATNFGALAKNLLEMSYKAKERIQSIKNQAKSKLEKITHNTPLGKLLQYKDLVPVVHIDRVKDFYVSKIKKKHGIPLIPILNVSKAKDYVPKLKKIEHKQHINTNKRYLKETLVDTKKYVPETLAAKNREKTPALDGLRLKENYLKAVFEGRFPYPVGTKKIVYIYE